MEQTERLLKPKSITIRRKEIICTKNLFYYMMETGIMSTEGDITDPSVELK